MKKNSLSIYLWSAHQRCSTKINCSEKFGSKIPVLSKSLFNKVASLHPCPATSLKRDSSIGVFLWILRDFKNITLKNIWERLLLWTCLKVNQNNSFLWRSTKPFDVQQKIKMNEISAQQSILKYLHFQWKESITYFCLQKISTSRSSCE